MPYFGRQGQFLGMKWPDNLCKQVAFVTVDQRIAVRPLVGSKSSLIKYFIVPYPDILWAYSFSRLMSGWCSDTQPLPLPCSAPFRMFDTFREKYLCTLKRFLFLSIRRLFHLVFRQNIHGKILEEFFGRFFRVPASLRRY